MFCKQSAGDVSNTVQSSAQENNAIALTSILINKKIWQLFSCHDKQLFYF